MFYKTCLHIEYFSLVLLCDSSSKDGLVFSHSQGLMCRGSVSVKIFRKLMNILSNKNGVLPVLPAYAGCVVEHCGYINITVS